MAPPLTIKTRDQLGRYLQSQAEQMARLSLERSVLRDLVAQAFDLRERMPKEWNAAAKTALHQIKE